MALFVLLFSALNEFSPAMAQLRFGILKNDRQTVFALAPREATRPLKIAEKSIEDGDFQQATRLLGDLLADSMLNEYIIADKKNWGRAVSLRQKAEQLLGEIPLDQRTSYQEKYGVKAKVMLEKAVQANDMQAIAMTSRLYFHTHAGLEATMLVGHSHLGDGRPVMAAVAFEKVVNQPLGEERFDPEATLLAAVSWSLNGSTERSEKLLRSLKEKQRDAEVRFYGKTVPLFDDGTPLESWLKEIVTSTPLQSHPVVNQWLVFRGDSQRNAESGSGFPLLSPRWSIRTVTDPKDEAGIHEFQQKLIQAKVSPTPKVHPLAIGKTLVIRTEDRMFGVDADTGKRLWSYPPPDVFRSRVSKLEDSLHRPSNKLHQDKLRERLWLDALYGQISSDGDSIFLIPNPGISTDGDDWRNFQTQVYDEPTDLRLYNELKSLDLKQQGALQWQVGGESGLDEPELAKAFFLGAPLPIGDRLYAICLQERSVRLVVLDSETGRLQWGRHLASTEEAVSFREDRLRRLAGATPSEANGVLICPTGLNAIVAVDLATKSLSWGFQFEVPKRTRIDRLTDQLNKWDTMWRDATVTLAGGVVVYTPIASDEVYCLNLQTGESLWKDRRRKQIKGTYKAMHVETVRNGNVIITSTDRLKAIDLKKGTVSWQLRLEDYGLVSGRGYVSGDYCFIPTTTKKVLKINTVTGEVDGVAMTEKVLGNLISFRGDVISHGADHLTAYPRDEPSRLMLEQDVEMRADDHSRLAIKAQLHLLDGEYEQSVDAISQAYDLFPNSNYAKVLVQSLTRLIDVDFAKAEKVSDRYQNLFEKQDLQRLLHGKVSGLMKLNRFDEAFETLLEIAETIDLAPPSAEVAGQKIETQNSVVLVAASVDEAESFAKYSANAELTMQLTQWLRWKLDEVYQSFDAEAQETYRVAVTKHLTSFQDDSHTIRHDRIRLFPSDSLDDNLRMETAVGLLSEEQYVRANSLLPLDDDADSKSDLEDKTSIAGPSNGILARARLLLEKVIEAGLPSGTIASLKKTIVQLETFQSPERPIFAEDLYESSSSVTKVGQILRTDEVNVQWSRDVTRIEQETRSNYFISSQHFCEIVATDQPELHTLSFRYTDEFREFRMYDRFGRFVHKTYLDPAGNYQGTKQGTKGRIFLHNSLLLLCINDEMFAIDWERFIRGKSALLWDAEKVVSSSSGITSKTMEGISVLSDGLLKYISPFTGEVLWQRSQVSSRANLLEGAKSLTVWNRAWRTYDNVDPMAGRLLSCGRMDKYSSAPSLGSPSVAVRDFQLFEERKQAPQIAEDKDDQGDSDNELDLIFSSKQKPDSESELNLFDYYQQKVLWTKTLPYPTHKALVDQESLLVLSSDGVFSMIDFRSGAMKFETRIPELEDSVVSSIVVNKFKGMYVVSVYSVTQRPESVKQDEVSVTFQRMHKDNAMINGHVIALDASTGKSVWKFPIEVQSFQSLEGLPWDSPFLFLTRRNRYNSENTHVRIQMAMIDLQSGKLKANELFKVPVRDNVFYRVTCQPQSEEGGQQIIELQIAALTAKFYLSDITTPPQPVAVLTNLGSFKRMKKELSPPPPVAPLATDFQRLIDQATAAEQERIELSKEEARLIELEMKKK